MAQDKRLPLLANWHIKRSVTGMTVTGYDVVAQVEAAFDIETVATRHRTDDLDGWHRNSVARCLIGEQVVCFLG